MTTNGYPPSNSTWASGNDEPTMQFDRVQSYPQQDVPPYPQQGNWEAPPQSQPYYQKKRRNPMLIVLVIVTVLVFIVLASAAFLAYKTMSTPPITSAESTAQTTAAAPKTTGADATPSMRESSKTSPKPTTSKSSSATPGAAPGSRPKKANLPPAATPVNSAAASGADAGYLVNLYKSGNTSDEFANAVHQAYLAQYSKPPTGVHTVVASSPVTGKTYEMKCKDEGSYVHCSGGVEAHVYFA